MSPRERAQNKSQANKQERHGDLFYRGSVLANLLPVEEATKAGSLSTLPSLKRSLRTSEKEKKQSKRKSSNEHGKSLSLVTRALCGIGEDLISLVCLKLNARALVVVEKWKTWMQ
jgi:hypothetical protein